MIDPEKTGPNWLWGDSHTHSHWSDGLESIKELTAFFLQTDQSFHLQTDHCGIDMPSGIYLRKTDVAVPGCLLVPENFGRYMEECRLASTGGHIVAPGIELDLDYGSLEVNAKNHYCHIKIYGFSDPGQLPPEGWYAHKDFFSVLKGMRERGLTVCLAHTNGDFLPWQDLVDPIFDGFEISYNMFDRNSPFDKGAIKCGFWDKWLSSGRHVPVSTGSDCHQADMAGFSMRNVVAVDDFTEEAVVRGLKEGKSYLSATWHPDVYQKLGLEGRDGEVLHRFACWFQLVESNRRAAARPKIQRIISGMLEENYGRVKQKDYPVLAFEAEGCGSGGAVRVSSGKHIKVKIDVRMNVPIECIDLIQDGTLIKRFSPRSRDFVEELVCSVSAGKSYLRLQCRGMDEAGHTEWLISNPVYFTQE